MRTHLKGHRDRGRGRLRGDEGGFLLVMVMVVMLVLSTMVASTLINSFLERSLAKNQNYASVALQAAEGGLAAGVTWVRENQSALPTPYTANPTWTQTLSRSLASGGTYNVTLRFKREWRDINGDGDCVDPGEDSGYKDGDAQTPATACPGDIVLYNKCSGVDGCFNFPDSLYFNTNQGYPVIEIDSVGFYGSDAATASSYREIALDLARNRVNVNVKGAVTARSNVTVTGSGYVDGHNFNEAGTAASTSCSDLPAVTVSAGSSLTADCTTGGIPGGNPKGTFSSVAGCNDSGGVGLSKNPWDALGIDEASFNTVFTVTTTLAGMPGTATAPAYVWQKGDLLVNGGNGYGILVVHNEHFDPDIYDVSHPGTAKYNTADPKYDPRADSGNPLYDASYAPATMRMNGTCSFTGVIIADQILRVNGTATTVGAVISTGGVSVDGDVTGNWAAKYSCDAIEKALGGFGYGTRIAWHRLR